MAFVYEIHNDINDMVYIGMTQSDKMTPAKKLRQHRHDHTKEIFKNKKPGETGYRPMYNDMNKYGTEHFHIRVLCECTSEDAPIKENEIIASYPVEKLYNTATGGLGKPLVSDKEKDIFRKLYESGKTVVEIAKETNYSSDTVSFHLHKMGYTKKQIRENKRKNESNIILQLDKQGNVINKYSSTEEAGRALVNPRAERHIRSVCKGQRKTAYGYIWQYA